MDSQEETPHGDGATEGAAEGAEDGAQDQSVGSRIAKDPIELGFLVPLPEKINIGSMPRVEGSRQTFRDGMARVEEAFADHMRRIHLDFEEKARAWESVQ